MNVLLIESDKIVRDQIKVGLECIQEITVEIADGFSAVNRARQASFDYIMIGHDPDQQDGLTEVHNLREFDLETSVILITPARQAKNLSKERTRLNIYSCLNRPINERDFFRLVTRMRERVAGADVRPVTDSESSRGTPFRS